ncbi:hypothetical protein GIB67_039805 [Kingdonia uniflora]|uniref:Uncharacterized protein n=1 Tax=Kingdonia uniflora TaxID=39325 RepID=A0A7J7P3Z2_9MAGN|nr:hypothetical protein GIB67_039805 [Kingdonia uniflora]
MYTKYEFRHKHKHVSRAKRGIRDTRAGHSKGMGGIPFAGNKGTKLGMPLVNTCAGHVIYTNKPKNQSPEKPNTYPTPSSATFLPSKTATSAVLSATTTTTTKAANNSNAGTNHSKALVTPPTSMKY